MLRTRRRLTLFIVALFSITGCCFDNAMQRSNRAKTRDALQAIGIACEAYFHDHKSYPGATSMDELAVALTPKYLPELPRLDAWGNKLRYQSFLEKPDDPQSGRYVIASSSRDGLWEKEDLREYQNVGRTPEGDFSRDIVYSAGEFYQLMQ
jgi:hypothetical protein